MFQAEFSKFGAVSDVRINLSKGKVGLKGPGHHVPNFGFVTFEDEEAVRSCLSKKVRTSYFIILFLPTNSIVFVPD